MKHLGNILEIDWSTVEIPDIVVGGSPCQDLSVAGKRAGLQGERSGLFMEQIRCFKELRNLDRIRRPNTDESFRRPRYMLWENVPGARSLKADFAAVIEECIKAAEQDADCNVLPPDRWPQCGCFYDEDGKWSIAYTQHDAQYWGVPQRRKRISLLVDANGWTAPEIIFDPQFVRETERNDTDQAVGCAGEERFSPILPFAPCLPRDIEPGKEAWEGTPGGTADSTGTASVAGVIEGCGSRESHHGDGYKGGEHPMYTLNSVERHAVAVDGYNGSLSQEASTLGVNCGMSTERNAVACDLRNGSEDNVMGTIQSSMKQNINSNGTIREFVKPAKTLKIRSGCDGGGKGALVQIEKSATLSCNNDQTLFYDGGNT